MLNALITRSSAIIFPGTGGGLWKNDTGGPGGDLRFVGDNPNTYSKAFEPKNKQAESKEEVLQLLTFIKDINEVPDDKFEQLLSQKLDIDNFLQTTAVMLLSGAFDQLTGWGPHNYYLYRVPRSATASTKWHYLPWDLDVGFCEIAFGKVYVIEDWNAAWPIPLGTRNPLLERLIQNPKAAGEIPSDRIGHSGNPFHPPATVQHSRCKVRTYTRRTDERSVSEATCNRTYGSKLRRHR